MSEHLSGPLVAEQEIPPWLRRLTADVGAVDQSVLSRGGDRARIAARFRAQRSAAVLVLLSGGWDAVADHPGGLPADAEILLTERATTMRTHSGQVAFPGGAEDPGDDFPVGTALREAEEETGLDPASVRILARFNSFPVPSGFAVTPVLAHEPDPGPVSVVDPAETSLVTRVPLRRLLSPEHRLQVRRSFLGGRIYQGPAFFIDGLLVWGFTGGIIAAMSEAAGWDVPWNTADVRPLDEMIARAGGRQAGFAEPGAEAPGGEAMR